MTTEFVVVALGLAILLIGGDLLVRGAVALALRLGITPLVVSLTIVALGTSAPELLIAVDSVIKGAPDIAFGNVVGSNIANVLLVLGLPALIAPVAAGNGSAKRTFFFMIAASVLFIAMSLMGPIGPIQGAIMIAFFVFFLVDTFRVSRRDRRDLDAPTGVKGMSGWQIAGFLILGLVGLPVGADMMVEGSVKIAKAWGVSEAVIGLTIIAIGTSLPELATAVIAAVRREADVAIGNVIGSNLFNILFILGTAAFFGKLPPPERFLGFDLWVMLAASLALLPAILWRRDLTFVWGLLFLSAYAAYLVTLM